MYPGDIENIMTELKAKALEIGDVSTFKVSNRNGLPTEATTSIGASKNYHLNATVMNGENAIDSSRITYSATVKNGSGTATISNLNTLVVTGGSQTGYTTVEVAVLVDGVQVGTQTMTVKSLSANIDWGSMTTKYNGYISDGSANTPNGVQSLGDLYNNNGVNKFTFRHRYDRRKLDRLCSNR